MLILFTTSLISSGLNRKQTMNRYSKRTKQVLMKISDDNYYNYCSCFKNCETDVWDSLKRQKSESNWCLATYIQFVATRTAQTWECGNWVQSRYTRWLKNKLFSRPAQNGPAPLSLSPKQWLIEIWPWRSQIQSGASQKILSSVKDGEVYWLL